MSARDREYTHRGVRPVVVCFDVIEVTSGLESIVAPVETTQPEVDGRVPVADGLQVTLEMADVDRIEANLWMTCHETCSNREIWELYAQS